MHRKLDPQLLHAGIRARILGGSATPSRSSRDRTRMVAAGNPDVIREAEGQPANPRYRSGRTWNEGLRARPRRPRPRQARHAGYRKKKGRHLLMELGDRNG
jgi:hypothetical protein